MDLYSPWYSLRKEFYGTYAKAETLFLCSFLGEIILSPLSAYIARFLGSFFVFPQPPGPRLPEPSNRSPGVQAKTVRRVR